MNKRKWLLALSLLIFTSSCSNTKSTRNNVLPFGLQYGMSSESAYNILDSLSVEGVLEIENEYGYLYRFQNGTKLRVLLGFTDNDKLGIAEITNSEMHGAYGKASEAQLKKFITEQGVNLTNWVYRKPTEKRFNDIHQYSHDECHLTYTSMDSYSSVTFGRYDMEAKIVDLVAQKNKEELEEYLVKRRAAGVGESVTGNIQNSPWDGSVYQVKKYLKKNLNNPKSYESISWSAVHYDSSINKYYVQHTYRAQNGFGAIVLCSQTFEIDSQGNVINVVDM